MACVALTSLIATIKIEFLLPTSRVSLHDRAPIKSFVANLSSLQAILQKYSSGDGGAAKDLEIQIRDFALEAEDDIELQLRNFLLAKATEHEEDASQELRQTLRKAAEIAEELLQIINKEIGYEREREMTFNVLTSLIKTIELQFLQPPTSRVRFSDFSLSDRPAIIPFLANLSCLQAFLQNKSSGDGGPLRDLEIQIRDFVLDAEDDIKIQLSNYVNDEDSLSYSLCPNLQRAADNASKLLKILTMENKSYASEREMASTALTILIAKFKYYFLQTFLTVYARDKATMIHFSAKLYSLQFCLLQTKSNGGDAAIKIRNFALKAVNDIEKQLPNVLLAKDTEHEGEVSQRLRQPLQEAAEVAAELLKIIHKEETHEREREMTCGIKSTLLEKLSSLQGFMQEESSGGSATTKDLKTKIRIFTLKASWGLHQVLQEATANTTELLEIITKVKREMAFDALYTFMSKFYFDFLHSTPVVPLDDKAAMISFFEKLSSLQDYLLQKESSCGAGGTGNDLETEIIDFVLVAGDDVETQVKNLVQAKDNTEYQGKASQLNQTLREAAEIAAELLISINSEKECKNEIEIACLALSSLMATIEEFLYAEVATKSFLKSLHDKAGIKSNVLEKLFSLQVFLQKESNGGGRGAAMKDLETQIKDFTLKAKDDIKIQLNNFLQAKETEYEEKVSQELHQTMKEAAESAAELLKIINSRSNEVDEANETQPSNTWLKHAASKSTNVESDGSSHGFLKPEGRMVGRHHDFTVVKHELFHFPPAVGPYIISIVGMVGIGKSTLARKLYEDPSVASHFDVRCWVTIPQHYNKRRMLRELLQSITPEEPNVIKTERTSDVLEMLVRKHLRGRKYLIVLDNIMINQPLNDIIQCVPYGIGKICILLTTRHSYGYTHWHRYVHHMTLLDPKESWELFCNVLSIDEEHCAPKFEKIRNHVVEKCDGLPQLIVEVAKRLSKCNNIQEGWKKIEKELESLGILDRNSIFVGYDMLPHHLKVCFLYFGVFPKRKKIRVKMLIRLWIAEGFVKPMEHKELEDQAYEYLQELINRSLLLIEDRSCNGKIKTCRMHSAMHSFCVVEAQKEGILCAVNTQQHLGLSLKAFANSCRWLSLYSHSFDYYVLFGTNIPRSIFFFHDNPEMFVPPKPLRVLAFDTSISLQRVPVQLGGSIFLRYLSITQWFGDLNDVVSNNPNLQTLVVYGNGAPTVHLPSSIWKPPHLRNLQLGNLYMVDPPSVDKKNLQTLSWVVRPVHCGKEVYNKFPKIKNLKILLKDDIEHGHIGVSSNNRIILDHFYYLEGLEKLSISVSIGCNAALPELCMYPSGLMKLELSGTNISERDLNVIAMLPELMVLKLKNSFHGTLWELPGGFRKLIFLLLEAKELKNWEVSKWDHFRKLRHLILRSCNCLKQMPKDFRGLNLETIELEGCQSSLVASAKQFQQKRGLPNLKIKILDPAKYDESQNART